MMFMMNREFAEQIFSGVDLSEIDENLVPLVYFDIKMEKAYGYRQKGSA